MFGVSVPCIVLTERCSYPIPYLPHTLSGRDVVTRNIRNWRIQKGSDLAELD